MKCRDCGADAVVRVHVNGESSVVCEEHRIAIVRRIDQVVKRFGHVPNLREITVMSLGNITFEDLPLELPPSSVLK